MKDKETESKIIEISFQPSTIETIDYAVFNWIDKELNISSVTNEGWKKVPVIWASAERAYQSKRSKELRDREGTLNFPLITLERQTLEKDLTKKGSIWANIPQVNDEKGGSIMVARRIQQVKTSNFANADSKKRFQQINFPRKNNKVVYETMSMPLPIYVTVFYQAKIRTNYQQQMNEIVQPFITVPQGINNFIIKHEEHKFECFIDSSYENLSNSSGLESEERFFETVIKLKVLGYLIGQDKNQENPKIIIRENAVEVKMPRERIVFGDILEHTGIGELSGIESLKGQKISGSLS